MSSSPALWRRRGGEVGLFTFLVIRTKMTCIYRVILTCSQCIISNPALPFPMQGRISKILLSKSIKCFLFWFFKKMSISWLSNFDESNEAKMQFQKAKVWKFALEWPPVPPPPPLLYWGVFLPPNTLIHLNLVTPQEEANWSSSYKRQIWLCLLNFLNRYHSNCNDIEILKCLKNL